MRTSLGFFFSFFFIAATVFKPQVSLGKSGKNIAITLPAVRMGPPGTEGEIRGEYNLNSNGAIALEWTSWGQKTEGRQELTEKEKTEKPGESMTSYGQNIGIMLGRYSDGKNMSGFHWGLGAGYRRASIDWIKEKETDSDPAFHNYKVEALGPTFSGRLGYRYLAEEIGFILGFYLGIKHFESRIEDTDSAKLNIPHKTAASLKRKIKSKGHLGAEIGWAF